MVFSPRSRDRAGSTAPATRARLETEGWRGQDLAIRARIAALILIALWLVIAIPKFYTLFQHAFIALFLALGILQLHLLRSGQGRSWHAFAFAACDGVLLAAVLLAPNPLLDPHPPPALALRYSNIVFLFVFLAGSALTLSPLLVLWTAVCLIVPWGFGVWLLVQDPATLTERDPPFTTATTLQETVQAFLRPDLVDVNIQIKKAFVFLLVAGILALVVERARRIVHRQAVAERERTNLSRYFSPNLVPALAGQERPFGDVRRQPIAILFADIKGFTSLCEQLPPEAVVDLCRDMNARLSACVFAHDGTLDKFTGDGLMATFGTPEPGPDDATRALAAARSMLTAIREMNTLRARRQQPEIEIGIGVHYGQVVQGDVSGGERSDFTVLGDAVNVAARLERLTRELASDLVVSQRLIDQLGEETTLPDLDRLVPAGEVPVRGREGRLKIWLLRPDGERRSPATDEASLREPPQNIP